MANLIIKPSAGGDLVIKGSDESPAITVGATGTTTFAENLTLSGTANNLGTTTAGTLSSGVTFPAGHVIQTVVTSKTDEASATRTASGYVKVVDGSGNEEWTGTITNIVSGNKVLVQMNFGTYQYNSDGSDGGGYCIYRANTIVHSHSSAHSDYFGDQSTNINWYDMKTMSFLDTSPAVGSNTYTLGYAKYSSGGININSNAYPFTCILQEIKG